MARFPQINSPLGGIPTDRGALGTTQRSISAGANHVPMRTASGGATAGTFGTPSRGGPIAPRGMGNSAIPNGNPHGRAPGGRLSSPKIVPASRSAFQAGMPALDPMSTAFGALASPGGMAAASNPSGVPNAPTVNRGGGVPRAEVSRTRRKDFIY